LLWNISEQCNDNCEFCAFGHSSEVKSQISELNIVIEQMKKIKIDKIDISTGNIVDINYLKNCITELKKSGYKITLTATSKIIGELDPDFIADNVSVVEFTYDSISSNRHRSSNYNESNYSCIKSLSKNLAKKPVAFKALIIVYLHLTFKNFKGVIDKLRKIGVKNVTVIRLMPVGFMSDKQYPEKLKNKKIYEEYSEYCKTNGDVEMHCSFDGIFNNEIKYCNKGITKLSMGPTGDIYCCPWGEHLLDSNRLFKLGNILNDDIVDIINNQDFNDMKNENFSCQIFNVVENEDFLYK
jgi:MoaA/NifB/PqqE/SkfB family radical SAM enzyme